MTIDPRVDLVELLCWIEAPELGVTNKQFEYLAPHLRWHPCSRLFDNERRPVIYGPRPRIGTMHGQLSVGGGGGDLRDGRAPPTGGAAGLPPGYAGRSLGVRPIEPMSLTEGSPRPSNAPSASPAWLFKG